MWEDEPVDSWQGHWNQPCPAELGVARERRYGGIFLLSIPRFTFELKTLICNIMKELFILRALCTICASCVHKRLHRMLIFNGAL